MNEQFWSPIKLSLEVAFLSLLFVFLFGTLLAWVMQRKKGKGKLLLETIFMLPLVLPPSVIGFLLIIVFGMNSPVGRWMEALFNEPIIFTWWAAVIASTVVAFPLMYQSAKTGYSTVDHGVEEASRIDGANEWKVFLYITLPLALKSIISGAILSFTRALGEFGATLMFAGNIPGKTQTIPTAIYIAFESGDMHLAWLFVVTMIAISFMLLLLTSFIK